MQGGHSDASDEILQESDKPDSGGGGARDP